MLDQAFEKLSALDWGQDLDCVQEIDQAIVDSHGDADARKDLEMRLIAVLQGDGTRNGKDTACRKLKVIGTEASVGTLASMLTDEQHAHMARYALESMPVEAAGNALRDALASTSGKLKVGVISSLGVRQEDASVAALADLVADSDGTVAQAAAFALGAIRSSTAAKALNATAAKANPAAAGAVADASLACAEQLLSSGDKTGALVVYKRLAKDSMPKHVKLAATRGILACAAR